MVATVDDRFQTGVNISERRCGRPPTYWHTRDRVRLFTKICKKKILFYERIIIIRRSSSRNHQRLSRYETRDCPLFPATKMIPAFTSTTRTCRLPFVYILIITPFLYNCVQVYSGQRLVTSSLPLLLLPHNTRPDERPDHRILLCTMVLRKKRKLIVILVFHVRFAYKCSASVQVHGDNIPPTIALCRCRDTFTGRHWTDIRYHLP